MMNHDATHCADYAPEKCPEDCYRAQLTAEWYEHYDELGRHPTSWSYFSRSAECPMNRGPVE